MSKPGQESLYLSSQIGGLAVVNDHEVAKGDEVSNAQFQIVLVQCLAGRLRGEEVWRSCAESLVPDCRTRMNRDKVDRRKHRPYKVPLCLGSEAVYAKRTSQLCCMRGKRWLNKAKRSLGLPLRDRRARDLKRWTFNPVAKSYRIAQR